MDDLLTTAEEREPEFDFGNLLGVAFAAFVVAALVILVTYGLLGKSAPAGPALLYKEAPDFTIELFGGGSFTLSEMRGEPVVVNIWASWCKPCRAEMPAFENVWRQYKDRGVVFVGVDYQDNEEDATAFLEELDITYMNGPDVGDNIYEEYEATGVPETFFIDRNGIIVRKFIGDLSEAQLATFVEDLLREE